MYFYVGAAQTDGIMKVRSFSFWHSFGLGVSVKSSAARSAQHCAELMQLKAIVLGAIDSSVQL